MKKTETIFCKIKDNLKRAAAAAVSFTMLASVFPSYAEGEDAAEEEEIHGTYYVCFSDEDYRIANANVMSYEDGEYFLYDHTMSSDDDFYIADDSGARYYGTDGSAFKVTESDDLRYTIKFSPSALYTDDSGEYAATGGHATYCFYSPADVTVLINGAETAMTYNSYYTAYDEYYISSIKLSAGDTVAYGDETHTVSADGYYRILYTPGRETGGSVFKFDANGNYGSGEDYTFCIYIEDAPRYFLSFTETISGVSADTIINGEPAVLLTRYEKTTAAAEYRTKEIFLGGTDSVVKYRIYEEQPNGTYRMIDDDNDEDTTFSKLETKDAGWYAISFTDSGSSYSSALQRKTYRFDGWYLIGNINNWGFTADGELDLDSNYKFDLIEDTDSDYNEDYEQYRLVIYVTKADLKDDDYKFYISDGDSTYRNLEEYISIDTEGEYEIIFSEDHVYDRGRNYYYTLQEENRDMTEVLISTVDEYIEFAKKCNASSEYSAGAEAYLVCDLDFDGVSFLPITVFNGIFHGGYHTMKNITIDGTESSICGVFGTLSKDAKIERLTLENLNIDQSDENYVGFVCKNYGTVLAVTVKGNITGKSYVGGIAAYNGRTTETTGSTEDIYIDGLIKNCVSECSVTGLSNVGGIVGYSDGELRLDTNNGTVYGKSNDRNTTCVNIGGAAGYSSGRIAECSNNGNVSAESTVTNIGGISGLCTGEIYFSKNMGDVTGTKYAGGLAGYYGTVSENDTDSASFYKNMNFESFVGMFEEDQGSYEQVDGREHIISYCVNGGKITAGSNVGGIVGYTEQTFNIENCISDGDIKATAGNYAGGILGNGKNATVKGCMTTGSVCGDGMNAGEYVGGIAGYAANVTNCSSSAILKGSNLVGGIAGSVVTAIKGCYTNVLITADQAAVDIGDIAGSAESYQPADSSFGGNVAYNYYVGTTGGIGGLEYGSSSDHAAVHIDSDKLAGSGSLSPNLAAEFIAMNWCGGEEDSYPVLYYMLYVQETDEYGDDDEFNSLFDKYSDELLEYTKIYARKFYIVSFLEWNKDNGDLYDDGEIQYCNFDIIDYKRVYSGQTLDTTPDFKYAEQQQDGTWVYEGDEARYFVTIAAPGEVTGNMNVYAEYREIATTLKDDDGMILVEGTFDAETIVGLVWTHDGWMVTFSLDGKDITVDTFTVKYRIGEDVQQYRAIIDPGEKVAESSTSGEYLVFTLNDGETFQIEKAPEYVMPAWIGYVITGAACAAVTAAVFIIVIVIKKKHAKTSDKAEICAKTEEKQ